ncbi:hypothetical protein FHR92_003781 [Fontibacillus solani]|uniref:Uncharacterized protein n=1 Tax=Fontibacillus solani TaxID=1572857 RepID=A0A7W3SW47_9BACL|nr:hypothetical protein [Fontibacillus solani]MBA9087297.1 hypothetical protein [Fontibacillus solani]
MLREILIEIKNKLTLLFVILWLLFTVAIISFAVYRSQRYELRDWLDYFEFTLDGALPIIFPIIAILIYVTSFSEEVKNRFLIYTRMRRPLMDTIYIKFIANIILTFLFFFFLVLICFLFAYLIEPQLGIAQYNPAGYGLTNNNIIQDTYTRHTFSQLLKYGVFTYGLIYSLWVGVNGALYAAIGFLLVLLIRNRFLALSLPFISYIVVIFTLNALGLQIYRLNYSIFPFDRVQSPVWTAFIPFFFLMLFLVCLLIFVKKYNAKVGNFL